MKNLYANKEFYEVGPDGKLIGPLDTIRYCTKNGSKEITLGQEYAFCEIIDGIITRAFKKDEIVVKIREEGELKTDKDIGLIKKLILRLITFFQVACLKQRNMDFYYSLTKLHFKLYFGKDLIEEATYLSKSFQKAQIRHANMVMIEALNIYKLNKKNKVLFNAAKNSFYKNLLLEASA